MTAKKQKAKSTKENTSGSFQPKRGGSKEDKGEPAGGRRGKKGKKGGRR